MLLVKVFRVKLVANSWCAKETKANERGSKKLCNKTELQITSNLYCDNEVLGRQPAFCIAVSVAGESSLLILIFGSQSNYLKIDNFTIFIQIMDIQR